VSFTRQEFQNLDKVRVNKELAAGDGDIRNPRFQKSG